MNQVPRASLHIAALGLYSVLTFGSIVSNYERALPIGFQFSLLKSTSKDKIPIFESSKLYDFLHLVKGLFGRFGRFPVLSFPRAHLGHARARKCRKCTGSPART